MEPSISEYRTGGEDLEAQPQLSPGETLIQQQGICDLSLSKAGEGLHGEGDVSLLR